MQLSKMKIRKFVSMSRDERKDFILRHLPKTTDYKIILQKYKLQNKKGTNIILKRKKQNKNLLIISAHYDGPTALDSAISVFALFYLIKKIKADYYCFFDLEESFLLGSLWFFQTNKKFKKIKGLHLDIGALGVGKKLMFFNKEMKEFKLKKKGKIIIGISDSLASFNMPNISSFFISSFGKMGSKRLLSGEFIKLVGMMHKPNLWLIRKEFFIDNMHKLIDIIKNFEKIRKDYNNKKMFAL